MVEGGRCSIPDYASAGLARSSPSSLPPLELVCFGAWWVVYRSGRLQGDGGLFLTQRHRVSRPPPALGALPIDAAFVVALDLAAAVGQVAPEGY